MGVLDWSARVSYDEARRRVGGRRHYNSWRHDCASYRRLQVMRLLTKYGWRHGVATRIARQLGVHPSTISRDIWSVMTQRPCPTCGRPR